MPHWRWDQVLPLFKKSEDHYLGASELHGAGGEWRVEKQRLSWKILDAFREAAAEAGIEKITDFNTGNNAGCAYFEVNQRRGIRLNTAKAFLKPAAQRPNLTVMTGCHVERLLLEKTESGTVCRGVQFTGGGQAYTAHAQRETVLAAGAIGSPHILQLSGIGEGGHLQRHGVTPVVDLPGVGENLQDHLQLRMVYKVQGVKTLNVSASSWFGKMKIGLEYAFLRSGPMSMAPSQLGAFASSGPEQATPNLQYHVQPLSLEKFGDPLHGFPAFTASVCNLRPTARGHVRLSTHDSYAPPKITPNYLSTAEDRQTAAAALSLTRRIVASPALAAYQPQEFKPGIALPHRGRAGRSRRPDRHHDFSSGRHLQDGPRGRCASRRRQPIARDRRPGLARGRCLHHAVYYLGQYQCADPDDCRKGGGIDRRPCKVNKRRPCVNLHNRSAFYA